MRQNRGRDRADIERLSRGRGKAELVETDYKYCRGRAEVETGQR